VYTNQRGGLFSKETIKRRAKGAVPTKNSLEMGGECVFQQRIGKAVGVRLGPPRGKRVPSKGKLGEEDSFLILGRELRQGGVHSEKEHVSYLAKNTGNLTIRTPSMLGKLTGGKGLKTGGDWLGL